MDYVQKKTRALTIIIYLAHILSGVAIGLAIDNIGFHSLSSQFYELLVVGILLYAFGKYLRSLKIKYLELHLEAIDFIIAFREFEERNLFGLVKGSNDWFDALVPFQETCKMHSDTWAYLLQEEIENCRRIIR
jgi:hypothetical protein